MSQSAGEIEIVVEDEGLGFEEADRAHLFDIFYRGSRTSRQRSGSGIGLYVSRLLVEAMGGRIWAERRATAGSRFGFTLPLIVEDDDEPMFVGTVHSAE